jgi:tripartite-type tricarboxylate transporter receptor subunit TctC
VHIPFKGAGPGTTALLAGEVNMQFASVLPLMPHIKSERLRALAISGNNRSLMLPDVPTVSEFVPGYEATTWFGLLAPDATPAPVVMKIYSEVARIINVPEFRENLVSQGANPVGNTPEQFSAYIKSEITKWAKVVKATGAQVD